jgi:hypothetical protein
VRKKSEVAHMKSTSNAANNQAVSGTIGSKPNANWNVSRLHRRARKRLPRHQGRRVIAIAAMRGV